MIERPKILVSAGTVVPAGTGAVELLQPPNAPDWASYCEAVTFQIDVQAVTGSPTTWSLGAKFQLELPHVSGDQWTAARYVDLQTEQAANLIDEGVGFYAGAHTAPVGGAVGIIADNTDTLPITVGRTIRPGGRRPHVLLVPTASGGTSPGVTLTVIATPRV